MPYDNPPSDPQPRNLVVKPSRYSDPYANWGNQQITDSGVGFVNYGPNGPPSKPGQTPFEFPRMPAFHMPKFPDYTKMYEKQQALAERSAGIRDRDNMYKEYLAAADDAVNFIDAQIGKEQSAANLMGVDYEITDEERQQRISNYFASIWSEAHQAQLEGFMKKYGNPVGFKDFLITRGDASQSQDVANEPGSETIATSKGQKPLPMQQVDEGSTIGGGDKKSLNLLNL